MSVPAHPLPSQSPEAFWEERYAASVSRQRGKPGQWLQQKATGLTPGRVLELGCSTGDDSLWLAEQGWQVTAVDLSVQAVQTARRLAQEAGLSQQIEFFAQDLATRLPEGSFELVCAMYFQSPFDFPRILILQRAAAQVVPGGHLLIVTHASGPPWAKHPPHVLPTLAEDWAALCLPERDWEVLERGVLNRLARGPEGQEAELQDNLIFLRRKVD